MTQLGKFGPYTVSEDFVQKIVYPQRQVLVEGEEKTESMRVRISKRLLVLTHDVGDKVVFTIGKFGKRGSYRDSRILKKTVDLDHCIAEVSRMLGVNADKSAELLSANALTKEAKEAA